MPPQISFLKLDDKLTVPIKIFINRGVVSRPSSLSINSKSFITMNNKVDYFQIKLSNNYLNSLLNDKLNSVLRETLFLTPIAQLINVEDPQPYIRITNKIDSIKYNLIISKALIVTIRVYLNKFSLSDENYLLSINQANLFQKLLKSDYQLNLLIKRFNFVKQEPQLLVEEEDTIPETSEDLKKNLLYELLKVPVLNNLKNSIKLYLVNS